MSVAFRRDGDEEHLEPRFEIPIPPGPNLVTPRGLALIQARVAELEALLPDTSEEEALKALRRDLRYWRTRQATAQLAPQPTGETVAFGCTVTFRHAGRTRTITLVGDDEADPAGSLVSFSAPLSRAMIGAEPGDLVAFGGKADAIEVIGIDVSGSIKS